MLVTPLGLPFGQGSCSDLGSRVALPFLSLSSHQTCCGSYKGYDYQGLQGRLIRYIFECDRYGEPIAIRKKLAFGSVILGCVAVDKRLLPRYLKQERKRRKKKIYSFDYLELAKRRDGHVTVIGAPIGGSWSPADSR